MEAFWVSLSAALAVAIPALATAWAQSRIGPAAAASLAEKPELSTTAIIMIAIPETMVILGFVVAVIIMLRGGGVCNLYFGRLKNNKKFFRLPTSDFRLLIYQD